MTHSSIRGSKALPLQPRTLATGAALCAFLGLGFLGGRWTAEASAAPASVSLTRLAAPQRVASQASASSGCGHAHGADAAPEVDAALRSVEPIDPEASEVVEAPAVDLEPALTAARAAFEAPADEHVQDAAAAAAEDLAARAREDAATLDAVVAQLERSHDAGELELLAAVLGQVRDHEVEQLALQIAADDPEAARRLAAFDILDGHDAPSARPVALRALRQETDRDVRRAALRAIPEPVGASTDEAREVRAGLLPVLAGDSDPEARRRAAILLGRYAGSVADLQPVLAALTQDADPGVRAGCAFACELAGLRAPALADALSRAVAATGEDPLVRENAWFALAAQAPLAPEHHAVYQVFAADREAASEVAAAE